MVAIAEMEALRRFRGARRAGFGLRGRRLERAAQRIRIGIAAGIGDGQVSKASAM